MKKRVTQGIALLLGLSLFSLLSACHHHDYASPPHRVHRSVQYTQIAPPGVVGVQRTETRIESAAPAVVVQSAPPPATTEVEPPVASAPPPSEAGAALPIELSPGVSEVVKLAQAQVGDEVILNYINSSATAFHPTADELIYLADIGVSTDVINALIKKAPSPEQTGAEYLAAQEQREAVASTAPVGTPAQQVVVETPNAAQPAPAPVAVGGQVVQVQQPVVQTQTVVYEVAEPATYFQPVLAPYGTWVEIAPYGLCWQPTVAVVESGWRPYANRGRWLYTDHGWYWQSDYSWGWAPFHYGRWHRHTHHGWVWTPGRTWGPAWVSWRRSDAYCGWAPLPPAARYRSGFGFSYLDSNVGIHFEWGLSSHHYTYVPLRHFHSHHPHRHFVARNHVQDVHHHTSVINHHHSSRKKTFVNSGIPRDEIAKLSREEIQRVRVSDRPTGNRSVVRPDRVVRNGNELTIFRGGPRRGSDSRSGAATTRGEGSTGSPGAPLSGATAASTNKGGRTLTGAAAGSRRRSETNLGRTDAPAPSQRALVGRVAPGASKAGSSAKSSLAYSANRPKSGARPAPSLPGKRPKPLPKGIAAFQTGSVGQSAASTRRTVPRSSGRAQSTPRPVTSSPQPLKAPTRTLAAPQPVSSTPGPAASAPRPITSSAASPRPKAVGLNSPTPVTSSPKPLSPPAPVTSTPRRPATPEPLTIVRSPGQPRRSAPSVAPSGSSRPTFRPTAKQGPTPSPSRPAPARTVVRRAPVSSSPAPQSVSRPTGGFQNSRATQFRSQSQTFNSLNQSGTRSPSSRIAVAPSSSGQRTFSIAPSTRSAPRPTFNRPTPSPSPSRAAPQSRVQPSPSPTPRTVTPRSTPSRPTFSRPAPRSVAPQSRSTPSRSRTPVSRPGSPPSSRPRPNVN